MVDLYIIAAGLGSRMNINVPKALVAISDGVPNLTTTLQQVGHKFNHVFIVFNALVQNQWDQYYLEESKKYPGLFDNVHWIPIESGLGDGHAVMKAFEKTCTYRNLSKEVIVCWGDVFIPDASIIDEMLQVRLKGSACGIIPAVSEKNPYVTLLVDDDMKCRSADFSKHGEIHPHGLHDQSIFGFKKVNVWSALNTLHAALWKNGRYMTPSGELSFLHTFHYMYNVEEPFQVYQTVYPTMSFNTVEEVAAIQKEISAKWKSHQS